MEIKSPKVKTDRNSQIEIMFKKARKRLEYVKTRNGGTSGTSDSRYQTLWKTEVFNIFYDLEKTLRIRRKVV